MEYRCPLCLTVGNVTAKARGHRVRCLGCKEKFYIPDAPLPDRIQKGIFVAARNDDGEVVIALAKMSNDLNVQKRSTGYTALHIAAFSGRPYVARELIHRGAALEIKAYKTQHTPLSLAARENSRLILNWLLEKGVNADPRDPDGATPLHWAARKGNLSVAKALIDAGANVWAESETGLRPLQLAISLNQEKMVEYLTQVETTQGLIRRQLGKNATKKTRNRMLFGFGRRK